MNKATTCNLIYWEVSQQTYVQTLLPSLGVVIGRNSALTSNQIPSDTMNCLFPSNTFLPRTYYSFQVSKAAKICLKNRYFEERIRWMPCIGPKTWVQCQFFSASKRGFLVKRNLTDVPRNPNIPRKKKKRKESMILRLRSSKTYAGARR